MPKIVQAAVCRNGLIITGRRHFNCISKAVREHGWDAPVLQSEQGFVDDEGTYYTREEARRLVIENGQLPEHRRNGQLISEYLW